MANFSNNDGDDNGLVTTEVGISDPGTEKRAAVDPEGVEGGQREGDLLSLTKGTRLGIVGVGVEGSTSGSDQRLCDEVGVDGNCSIVGKTLYKLDKGDLKLLVKIDT